MEETYEVEVKFLLSNKDTVREAILAAGGTKLRLEHQSDSYYNHPCRSFPETDEALRLRHTKHLKDSRVAESKDTSIELTYKGPKVDEKSKTRVEYTINLRNEDLESMEQILQHIGFKYVANVLKKREFFDIGGITATLDEVTDVGSFIEFELIAIGTDGMQEARDRILDLVRSLGLEEKDMIRDSYLEMYLGKR